MEITLNINLLMKILLEIQIIIIAFHLLNEELLSYLSKKENLSVDVIRLTNAYGSFIIKNLIVGGLL